MVRTFVNRNGRPARLLPALLTVLALLALATSAAGQRAPRVNAVLFYSPTCPHCHQVLSVDLPPLVQAYGDRLRILAINTATPAGSELFQAALARYALSGGRVGVPTLVVGPTALVGSGEIPAEFPGIIERGLAGGGIDWPDIPGLAAVIAAQGLESAPAPPAEGPAPGTPGPERVPSREPPAEAPPPVGPAPVEAPPAELPTPAEVSPEQPPPSPPVPGDGAAAAAVQLFDGAAPSAPGMRERFGADPVGNGVAVVVLLAMVAALAAVAASLAGRLEWRPPPAWLIPLLAVLGLGVAAYLAYVEVTGATAVCGPVGDCNTVQQSPYARIGGMLPVGVLGIAGYLALLGAWLAGTRGDARRRRSARLLGWAAAAGGTAFSLYLTFLEPFVIGATCAWCVSSAILITLLLLAATPAAAAELRRRPAGLTPESRSSSR